VNAVRGRVEGADQAALREELRRALGRQWTEARALELADVGSDVIEETAARIDDAVSVRGLSTPEDAGGQGGTWVEAVIAAEELGASLAPSHILGDTAATFLLRMCDDARALDLLAGAVDGSRCTVLVAGQDARWTGGAAAATDGRVSGHWSHVPDVAGAGILLAPVVRNGVLAVAVARIEDSVATGPTVRIAATRSPDAFRPLRHVTLDAHPCDVITLPNPEEALLGASAIGAVVLAAEMLGGAAACLARTVEYTTSRVQFGRPIATFQALKHRIAGVVVSLEAARSVTYRAAERAVVATGPADPEFIMLARAAKAAASDALRLAADEAIQMHGGMGFTWEIPAHLYLKRWAGSAPLLGRPAEHRRLMLQSEMAGRKP
jgi:alkylation response protein AidB-like acyl-CoA dehydrogenase